jgi:two-component system, cell cycle response regulator
MDQQTRTAKVLVIDDEAMCRSVIGEHLGRVGYKVVEAADGSQGLRLALEEKPDLIILDLCMPGLDGFNVCRQLRAQEATRDLPVLLLTALSDRDSKFDGLAAGADDFLAKPVYSAELLTRVRNLLKIKLLKDQLDSLQCSVQQMLTPEAASAGLQRVLLVASPTTREEIDALLGERYQIMACSPREALAVALDFGPDTLLVEAEERLDEALELCRGLRAQRGLGSVPVVLLAQPLDPLTRLEAFNAGVDEWMIRPFHPLELVARLDAHARRRREQRSLEQRLQSAAQRAILDGLTGAHNRAFFDQHLHYHCELSARHRKFLSVIMLDLDHFKLVNDSFGHVVGDEVLRKLVGIIRVVTRSSDVLCRYGGEEFAILLPDTGKAEAVLVAERIRAAISDPEQWKPLPSSLTASLGVATFGEDAASAAALIETADQALYRAKQSGRNRVAQIEPYWRSSETLNVEPLFRSAQPPRANKSAQE